MYYLATIFWICFFTPQALVERIDSSFQANKIIYVEINIKNKGVQSLWELPRNMQSMEIVLSRIREKIPPGYELRIHPKSRLSARRYMLNYERTPACSTVSEGFAYLRSFKADYEKEMIAYREHKKAGAMLLTVVIEEFTSLGSSSISGGTGGRYTVTTNKDLVLKKSVKIKLLDISKHKKHSWENLEKRSGPSCETLLKEIPALVIE